MVLTHKARQQQQFRRESVVARASEIIFDLSKNCVTLIGLNSANRQAVQKRLRLNTRFKEVISLTLDDSALNYVVDILVFESVATGSSAVELIGNSCEHGATRVVTERGAIKFAQTNALLTIELTVLQLEKRFQNDS